MRHIVVMFLFGIWSTDDCSAEPAQRALLKPGSQDVLWIGPEESAVQALQRHQDAKKWPVGHPKQMASDRNPEHIRSLAGQESELRWEQCGDRGTYSFGFDTGDSIGLWLVPLAGAVVKKILIKPLDFVGTIEFFLHSSRYDGEANTSDCVDANGWVGSWEDGTWREGDNRCFNATPLGEQIWPDSGTAGLLVEITQQDLNEWLEVDLGVSGYPDVGSAPFFIDGHVVRNEGWGVGACRATVLPYHGFKYYDSTGTSPTGNRGWHIRSFSWDLYALVEYDEPPLSSRCWIDWSTSLLTTVSTDSREICVSISENPLTPPIEEVWVYWEAGGGIDSLQLTEAADSQFCGTIPGFDPGTEVVYWFGVLYEDGHWCYTLRSSYLIFEPQEPNLFINNTRFGNWIAGYYLSADYDGSYFGGYDVWDASNYGPASYEVLKNYRIVVDAQGGGPNTCVRDVGAWLDEYDHHYIVSGDEYLGECFYGWPEEPVDIQPGEFAHDYLGLETYYPDINFVKDGDQYGVSRILAVSDHPISSDLSDLLADSLLLNYDPNYEIGAPNWLDGVDPAEGASVPFFGIGRVLDSLLQATGTDTFATSVLHVLPNGNVVALFTFDVLSLNTMAVDGDTLHIEGYYWIGNHPYSPILTVLLFLHVDDIETEEELPAGFVLYPAYPNPFNPATIIEFSIPQSGSVTLTVYDVLGREVETILNRHMNVGHHKVQWNATGVPSGIYFVRMQAGSGQGFTQTRKVTVLR